MNKKSFNWEEFFRPTWGKLLAFILYITVLSSIINFMFMVSTGNNLVYTTLFNYILPLYTGPFNMLTLYIPIPYPDLMDIQGALAIKMEYTIITMLISLMTVIYKYFVVCLGIFAYKKYLQKK
jgi:hypothetical protein